MWEVTKEQKAEARIQKLADMLIDTNLQMGRLQDRVTYLEDWVHNRTSDDD